MTADESVEGLLRDMRAGRERLLAVLSGVSEEQFKRRPAQRPDSGEPAWCIAEVLAHLLQQERLRAGRIRLALERDGARVTPSPEAEHYEAAKAGRAAPVPQLVHGLLASRRELEKLLEQAASTPGGLERGVEHPRLGRQTVAWILREKVIAHEAEHTSQIEGIKGTSPPGPLSSLRRGE